MKSRLILALGATLAVALAVAPSALRAQHASATARGLSLSGLNHIQRHILSGLASFEGGIGTSARPARARAAGRASSAASTAGNLCPSNIRSNVLVNQNCLNISDEDLQGRGQAQNETAIAENPGNPSQIVSGFNDYRRGDGNCGGAFSRNGGRSFTDTTLPTGFTRGTNFGNAARQYWQGGGDSSVAWDSRGNAYFACQLFQRGPSTTNNPDQSSAIYVFRSTGNGGASWNFTGHPAVETFTTARSGLPFNDKPYMTIDNHPGSKFRDRIYLTWTLFDSNGTAYIMEVHSDDFGQTFSKPTVVSTDSSLCANTFGAPTPNGKCNENQFSDPFTGPDGTLYVAYNNFNNATSDSNDNHNQVLLARSTDGGQSFGSPTLVSKYYDLPDCATYQGGQDAGRACVPEKGTAQNSVFRATNYASGGVNPAHPKQVVVTFGSYINRDSNESNGCVPRGTSPTTGGNLFDGVKTAGACNNKILFSVSNDSGSTFTGTNTDPRQLPVATTANRQANTDQWWQWAAFTPSGNLVTSYYDRQYGSDETSGNMDISASTSRNLSSFTVRRATSTSMPLPTQFPDTQGNSEFFGDYTGLSAESGAHPLWMDTRTPDAFLCPGTAAPGVPPALCQGTEPNGLTANDQTVYTDTLPGS